MSIYNINFEFILRHDSLEDLTIPIQSCNGRIREGSPSYMQVVIPNYHLWASTIETYTTHCRTPQMVLVKVKDSTTRQEILMVEFENIRGDVGSKSNSIFLTGHRTFYNQSPKTVTLANVDYVRTGRDITAGVDHKLRCSPYLDVTAGDTVIYNYRNTQFVFVVDLLTLNANRYDTKIEVSSG